MITPVIVSHLLSSDVEPLVNYIRIVDKYIVRPPTTWIPKSFKEALVNRKDVLEYRQGNLANPGRSTLLEYVRWLMRPFSVNRRDRGSFYATC